MNKYWAKRLLRDKKHSINISEDFVNKSLKKVYKQASTEIEDALKKLYKDYEDKNGISLHEAKKTSPHTSNIKNIDALYKMLAENRSSLEEKRDKLPQGLITMMEKRFESMEKQLSALSKQGHISHLELLHAEIESSILTVSNAHQMNIYELLEEQFTDGYFKGIYEVQKGIGFGKNFVAPDRSAVEISIMKSWSKKNFSDRIWGHEKQLAKELKENITIGLIRGEGIDKMSKRLQKRLDVSESNARRLVRTESAYIHEQAGLKAYEECGIERYQYLATLDRRTSKVCQELDGKIFEIKSAEVGVNYPPMHPNCRSTTVAAIADADSKRIARNAKGKTYEVPGNMTYKEWYNALGEDEQGQMRLENKKDRNRRRDKEQYQNYKNILGKKMLGFREFLDSKYSDQDLYQGIKDEINAIKNAAFFIENKQFGKKIGKHSVDYGLDERKKEDRKKMEEIIKNIRYNYDERRIGFWKGYTDDVVY